MTVGILMGAIGPRIAGWLLRLRKASRDEGRRLMAGPLLADGRGHDVFPASEEELLAELRRFDAEFRAEGEPRIVVIYGDPEDKGTPKLSIGLGADEATVCYDHGLSSAVSCGGRRGDKSKVANAMRSRLKPPLQRRGRHREIFYAYGDGHAEFFAWSRISREDALSSAGEFFRTGQRPTNIDWVDEDDAINDQNNAIKEELPPRQGRSSFADIKSMSFKAALKELEQIVTRLEKGDVDLEQSAEIYERGEALRAHCNQVLKPAR